MNTATGNFYEGFLDLAIPGRGVPLAFSRTYNSLAADRNGPLGYGWSHSYMTSLLVSGSTAVVSQENGSQVFFALVNGVWVAPARVAATLVHNGNGTWTLTRRAREFLTFDASGRLIKLEDLNGRAATPAYATTLAYDGSGRLQTVSDPAGRTLWLEYWASGLLKRVTDSSSPARSVNFAYDDGNGNLTDVTDAAGGVTHLSYDAAHRMVSLRDPNQDSSASPSPLEIHYDAQGRVAWQKDQLDRQTSFDYTTVSDATLVTDPKNNKTLHEYEDGKLVALTRGYGTAAAATWEYSYDPGGTLGVSSVVDPNGHEVISEYDAQGNLTRRTVDPGGLDRVTEYTYSALNDVESVTDAAGVTTTMTYSNGNLTSAARPLYDEDGETVLATRTTSYAYSSAAHPGDVSSITDPNGKVWSFAYSAVGNLASSTDPLGNKTAYCYDTAGRRTQTVAPKGTTGFSCPASPPDPPGAYTTTFTYDPLGRLLVTADALDHKTIRGYDPNGNLETVEDPNGNLTEYSYNLAGELVEVMRADATSLGYEYWPDGSLKTQIDGADHETGYAYDPLGHPVSVTDPLNRVTGYTHDPVGNLLKKTDPGGTCSGSPSGCTTYSYNAADELTSINYSDPATPDVTSISYDALGRRTSMTDGTGTATYQWDSLHRLVESTDGAGNTVGYGYDLKGQLTSILYPGQTQPVERDFDDAGRLDAITDWLGNETVFDHDANSNLDLVSYPNATTADNGFDAADRLMSITHKKGAATVGSFTYTRDSANQVASLLPTGVPQGNESYGYTELNQVQSVNSGTYSYDAADNLTGLASGKTLAYDAANQLTSMREPISFVGGGANHDATGTASSITVNLSAAPQANDQIILAIDEKEGQNGSPPSGYTSLGVFPGAGATDSELRLYRKTATGSEGASIQVGFNATPPHTKAVALVVYRGVHPTDPIDVLGAAGTAAAATSVTAPSVTTTGAGERLVLIESALGSVATLGSTWTPPVGMTERAHSGPNIPAVTVAIADKPLGAAGATGAQTATLSAAKDLIGVQIALKRAVTSYAYDSRGNRTSMSPPTGAATSYGYDQANRLKTVGGTSYSYNGDGLRATKTVAGATSRFVWGHSQGLPLLLSDGANYYVYDGQGLALEQIPIQKITYVGGGANHDAAGAAPSITVNLSAAPQANDQILLAIDEKAGQNGTPPSGFVSLGTFTGPGASTPELRLYRKTATGSEGSSLVVNFSVTPTHTKAAAAVIYRGVDLSVPVDVLGAIGTAAAATSVTAPSITTTTAGGQLVMIESALGAVGTLGSSWTAPADMTQRAESGPNIPAVTLAIADKTLGAPGATGAQTATLSSAKDLIGVLVAFKTPPPPVVYFHHDQLGSTRLLTNSAGSVVAAYTFDAYGTTTGKTGTASTPLQYAGEYTDGETGFQYLRARYYDPATGQFLSRDPIEALTGEAYQYGHNNPTNFRDPSGLCGFLGDGPCTPGGIASDLGERIGDVAGIAIATSPVGLVSRLTGKTLGGCIGADLYSALGFGGTLCVVATPNGGGGVTFSGSTGAGMPGGFGLSIGPTFSNGQSLSDLRGPFSYAELSAGEAPFAGGLNVAWSSIGCGSAIWQAVPFWMPFGWGLPFNGAVGGTTTYASGVE